MTRAKTTPAPSTDALVAEFNERYGHAGMRSRCKVCESDHWELVDKLIEGGAGNESIAQFLNDRFGFGISGSPIERHKKMRHAEKYQDS